jgi:hypothetical protein
MGIFSKVMEFTGLGQASKLLRTGATQAGRDAREAGEMTLAEQQALKQEVGGIYDPRIQAGNQASSELNDFYGGNQQGIIDQAQSSPFMSTLLQSADEGVARNSQMSGGFRTGTTQENFGKNSQNVLMSLVNQILQGKQGIAQAGYGAQDAYTNAMQNITAGVGNTRGQIANVGINQAAQRQNMIGGLVQGGISAFAGGI